MKDKQATQFIPQANPTGVMATPVRFDERRSAGTRPNDGAAPIYPSWCRRAGMRYVSNKGPLRASSHHEYSVWERAGVVEHATGPAGA